MIISGTCGACSHYRGDRCVLADSPFAGRSLWALACVGCRGYLRSAIPASAVSPESLAAVCRSS